MNLTVEMVQDAKTAVGNFRKGQNYDEDQLGGLYDWLEANGGTLKELNDSGFTEVLIALKLDGTIEHSGLVTAILEELICRTTPALERTVYLDNILNQWLKVKQSIAA